VRKLDPLYVRLALVLVPMIACLVILAIARERALVAAKPHPPVVVTLQTVATKAPAASTPSQASEAKAENASPPARDAALMAPTPFAKVLAALHYDRNISLAELLVPDLNARTAKAVSPSKLRELMDRGVVGYASAVTRDQKVRAVKLIELAAQLGYGPARDLVARNYPRSEAMQAVVPPADAIRYTLALVTAEEPRVDDADSLFLALVQQAAANGTLGTLARQLADQLRADRRARLSHRVDVVLAVLARVPGACAAVARVVGNGGDRPQDDCSSSLNQTLLQFAQSPSVLPAP
jgi:hypothetical protein